MKDRCFITIHFCLALGISQWQPACAQVKQTTLVREQYIAYTLQSTYPHDTTAYTEGLLYHNGHLYESTGWFGLSDIRQIEPGTGRLIRRQKIDTIYFGEGLACLGQRLYQLTWLTNVGLIYDAITLEPTGKFRFPAGEGWGLTSDGNDLIMSNGSDTLAWLDTARFQKVRTLKVTDSNGPVKNLNELEYIGGYIYANVYKTDQIVRIDPQSGKVAGRLDLTTFAQEAKTLNPKSAEMNGIAYDPEKQLLYITGKRWPKIYALRIFSK